MAERRMRMILNRQNLKLAGSGRYRVYTKRRKRRMF